jgi:hypothetical protein
MKREIAEHVHQKFWWHVTVVKGSRQSIRG